MHNLLHYLFRIFSFLLIAWLFLQNHLLTSEIVTKIL